MDIYSGSSNSLRFLQHKRVGQVGYVLMHENPSGTTSIIEISIEAGILLRGNSEWYKYVHNYDKERHSSFQC